MEIVSETIIANFEEGNFGLLEKSWELILGDETNYNNYIQAILSGNLKNFNLKSLQLVSIILDNLLNSCFNKLKALNDPDSKNEENLETENKELDDISKQLNILDAQNKELINRRSIYEEELKELISQLNSYLSKYIVIMSHGGTFITNVIAKAYFDSLITLSGSFDDLELYVANTLNLYSVCYRDNKEFLNEITFFYDELLALIKKINIQIDLKVAIDEEFNDFTTKCEEKTKELEKRMDSIVVIREANIEAQFVELYTKFFEYISFYEVLIKICSKNIEKSKCLLNNLVTSSNADVRSLCCANLKFNTYDFSDDEFPEVVEVYNLLKQVDFWLKDGNIREEDKMVIIELSKLIDIRFNCENVSFDIGYKSGQTYTSYNVSALTMDKNDFSLLLAFSEFSDFDVDSNKLLPITRAYLLYDLITSNRIEFIGEEPPFIKEIRNKGFGKKLVNPNMQV